jgi:hypothetical protein
LSVRRGAIQFRHTAGVAQVEFYLVRGGRGILRYGKKGDRHYLDLAEAI